MSVQTISATEFYKIRQAGGRAELVDVRTPAEYEQVHAEGARLVPLDRLDPKAFHDAGQPVYVICKSGQRAAKACQKLLAAGLTEVISIDGGTAAWEAAGLPIVRGTRKVISLERQVRIGAGLLVLLGVTLGAFVHPAFYGISAFVGAGLVFAGVTEWCGMGMLIARMPWNRGSGAVSCSA